MTENGFLIEIIIILTDFPLLYIIFINFVRNYKQYTCCTYLYNKLLCAAGCHTKQCLPEYTTGKMRLTNIFHWVP